MISRDEAHLLFVSFIVIGLLFYQLYFSCTSCYYSLSPSVVTEFFEQYIYSISLSCFKNKESRVSVSSFLSCYQSSCSRCDFSFLSHFLSVSLYPNMASTSTQSSSSSSSIRSGQSSTMASIPSYQMLNHTLAVKLD